MTPSLRDYERKRDLSVTPEPSTEGRARREGEAPRFVVQEHSARRLHWDLRLERDGALASWAIPKGIPPDPDENRLAVRTEDHPLEYLDFHGEIPAGQYGAGTVEIWDQGTYECEKWEERKVVVVFHGERLQGRYALFQTRSPKDWMIHRMDPPADPERQPMPECVVPMLARLAAAPPSGEGWAYEIKWDGVRAIAYVRPGELRLESRNLNEITAQYPELRGMTRELGAREAVIDGEVVALDNEGRPSFERLQQRMHHTSEPRIHRLAESAPVTYIAFDLLHLDGRTLLDEPYEERRRLLEGLGLDGERWQTPRYSSGDGAKLLEASRERGLEGLIAKRLNSRYCPGERTSAWLKLKNRASQEVVIGGWVPGKGHRSKRIGALLMGLYEREDTGLVLRYAGRVGSGFSEGMLDDLMERLGPMRRKDSPFGKGRPPKEAVFVDPELVGEVEFGEWTAQRLIRQAAFKGLREDKDPMEVVLDEVPAQPGSGNRDPRRTKEGKGKRRNKREGGSKSKKGGASTTSAPSLTGSAGETSSGRWEVEVEGRTLSLSNLDKVMYPKTGFTKGEMIDFYAQIGDVIVPHLQGRPLTLKRYPNGVDEKHFYEKRCPDHRPDWVETATVPSDRHGEIDYCLANDLPTLVWTANLASIELHTLLSRAADVTAPTAMVFDLDPGKPAGILDCCQVALWIRGMLEGVGLATYVKTSGSKGIQLYVPLNTKVTYERTKPYAKAVAETLERRMPDNVVSRMTKSLRKGKVLVDWSQNDEHKTTVCAYSLRAKEQPTVSTPLEWDEVERAVSNEDEGLLSFDYEAVLTRVKERGDLFAPVLTERQELPELPED